MFSSLERFKNLKELMKAKCGPSTGLGAQGHPWQRRPRRKGKANDETQKEQQVRMNALRLENLIGETGGGR